MPQDSFPSVAECEQLWSGDVAIVAGAQVQGCGISGPKRREVKSRLHH